MKTLVLASTGIYVIAVAFILVALLLIGLVLLQKNRGSGLSGAFGGVGGHSAFGTKTGDFLTWVTVGLAALFLGLGIAGNFVFDPGLNSTTSVTEPSDGAADSGAGDSSLPDLGDTPS